MMVQFCQVEQQLRTHREKTAGEEMKKRPESALTVLSVQKDFKAVGLVVVEGLSDFVDGLLVRQLSVHETGRQTDTSD